MAMSKQQMAYVQRFKRRIFVKRRYKKYIVNGATGSGKSTFMEFLAEKGLKQGCIVWDFWAAGTYENLFWCVPGKTDPKRRSDPAARRIGYPILIIHPRDTILQVNDPVCTCGRKEYEHNKYRVTPCLGMKVRTIKCKKFVPMIMGVPDNTPLSTIARMVLSEKRKIKRVVVFNEGFYDDLGTAYKVLGKMLKEFPYLIKRKVIPPNQPNIILFRELGDLVTGGMKTDKGAGQTEVRRQIQNLIRKNRHWHVHLMGDAQRNDDIAGAVADQKDFLILKRVTDDLIPERYQWIPNDILRRKTNAESNLDFSNYDKWPLPSQLTPTQCYIVHPDRFIELKTSTQPGFMHKGEHDDWEEIANVTVHSDVKDVIISEDGESGLPVTVKSTSEDEERIKVLQLAYELNQKEKKSYRDIATDKLHPSGIAEKWAKFGKPDSLQRAVYRAIQKGEVQQV